MKIKNFIFISIICALLVSCGSTSNAATVSTSDKSSVVDSSSVQKISADDLAVGWATYAKTKDLAGKSIVPPNSRKGIVGGAGGKVYSVKTRDEFLKAISFNGKKIIYVEKLIDLTDLGNGSMIPNEVTGSTAALDKFIAENTKGSAIECSTYQEWKTKYTASFNYTEDQSGPVAVVRNKLNEKWREIIVAYPTSDTTIIGANGGCGIIGGLYIKEINNIVLRNLEIWDCYNPFPAIEGDDGLNADFDAVTVRKSKWVWIDHCTFDTRFLPTDIEKDHYDTKDGVSVKWQVYDGLCDIVQTNDFVTVSWCHIKNHDKTQLIGSNDKQFADKNHQTITLDHNWYDNCVQRLPMVRFATIHIVNCVYTDQKRYGIDNRLDSRIYSECNSFEKAINSRTPNKKGDFYDKGSENLNLKDLDANPVWNPADYYTYNAQSPSEAKKSVMKYAGAGKLEVVR